MDKARNRLNSMVNRFLSKPQRGIRRGAKVRLDYEAITSDVNYKSKVPEYRAFIEANRGGVFTAAYDKRHKKDKAFVTLKEDSRWHFTVDELEVVATR